MSPRHKQEPPKTHKFKKELPNRSREFSGTVKQCAAISTATHNTCGLHIGKGVRLMNNFTHAHGTNARPEYIWQNHR